MNIASWIALFFTVLLPFIMRRRGNRRPCGSAGICFFTIAVLTIAAGIFFYVKNNRAVVSSMMPPTLHIPSRPVLPRITIPHITSPTLRVTTRPLVIRPPVWASPTTQTGNLWIENWPEFNTTTHWRGFRAESSDTCVTEAESREQAIDNAATTLSQLAVADPSIAADAKGRQVLSEYLKSDIAAQLQSGQFIADQFVRQTDKSYGTLYKTYLLIETPSSTIASLNQFARDVSSQAKSNEVTTWASTAGLFLVIILLYAFLNAATKGYFVWKLRATAFMVLIVAVLVLFAWNS